MGKLRISPEEKEVLPNQHSIVLGKVQHKRGRYQRLISEDVWIEEDEVEDLIERLEEIKEGR